jgi:HEAT repeat protein
LGVWAGSHPCLELQQSDKEEAVYRGKPTRFRMVQLEDHDPTYRQDAVQALEKFGPLEPSVVPAVGRMLKHRDPLVRVGAARALGQFGTEAQPALAALLATLDDDNVRNNIVAALGRIDPRDQAVLAAQVRASKDPSAAVRLTAIKSLGEIGRRPKGSLAAMREALMDRDPDVRQLAAEALARSYLP